MSGVPTGPSNDAGLAKFGEAEIGFGLTEFVIYGTDGRTVLKYLYDLRFLGPFAATLVTQHSTRPENLFARLRNGSNFISSATRRTERMV